MNTVFEYLPIALIAACIAGIVASLLDWID